MTNKGKWVKLIPSLAGGLYRFDGVTVEAVPLDAETLLRSSFKFDNMVMTGGKESRTYGVDMDTGRTVRGHVCLPISAGELEIVFFSETRVSWKKIVEKTVFPKGKVTENEHKSLRAQNRILQNWISLDVTYVSFGDFCLFTFKQVSY